jgi:hypothetical protein
LAKKSGLGLKFVAFATIAIVIVALCRHTGEISSEPAQFDPSNPLHLMATAAAGRLNGAFRCLQGKDMMEGEQLNVVLGSIPGRGPVLMRSDQYRPIFFG